MAVSESRVPPLVLTRSGNAGRAACAPLSLSSRLPVQLLKRVYDREGGMSRLKLANKKTVSI